MSMIEDFEELHDAVEDFKCVLIEELHINKIAEWSIERLDKLIRRARSGRFNKAE